jgi:branched-chain amino acid aminotransferase
MSKEEMIRVTQHVVETNREFLGENEDYMVTQVVSRGVSSMGRQLTGFRATVTVCCQLVHLHDFARSYFNGAAAVTPSIRRTPPQCLSPKAKISNKMNHFLAEFEAREGNPEAVSLMLDLEGYITENAGGNFLFVSGGRVMMPDRRGILPGISMETALELANSQGLPIVEGLYTPHDIYCAEEAFLTTTSYCILPVSSLNGIRIGSEVPGPVTKSLLIAWSKLVGVDIVGQAVSFLPPEEKTALNQIASPIQR